MLLTNFVKYLAYRRIFFFRGRSSVNLISEICLCCLKSSNSLIRVRHYLIGTMVTILTIIHHLCDSPLESNCALLAQTDGLLRFLYLQLAKDIGVIRVGHCICIRKGSRAWVNSWSTIKSIHIFLSQSYLLNKILEIFKALSIVQDGDGQLSLD